MSFTSTAETAPALRDPRAMRALAHPARLAMLEHLASQGPSTATECATVVGLSPSACSYHLRALARWGLVEETEGSDRRERRWRVLGPFVFADHEAPRAADVAAAEHLLTAQILDHATSRVMTWLDDSDNEPREWRSASVIGNGNLLVTAEELDEIVAGIEAMVTPYRARTRRGGEPADARLVHMHFSAVPARRNA